MRRSPWLPRRRAANATWVAVTVALVACAADPGARRTRRAMSEEEELELGREAAKQVEQYVGFSGSPQLQAYVNRIGQRLVKHSSRSHLDYEFHVVDMKEPNAFALPGGYIYVSRGLLALMNGEDELAAVLGHEIGHVAGRHAAQRRAKSRGWIPLQVLAGIGGAAASVVSPSLGSAVAGAGQLPAALVIAGYSRKQEEEADRLGQQYAAAEGWDPAALAATMDALTREQELAGGRDPNRMSFFDSHPTTPDRARKGREYAASLTVAPANRVAQGRTAFVERLDGLVVGDAARAGVFVENRFIHPDMGFALSFPTGWTRENTPTAVLGYPADESAVVALQVAGEGEDPTAVADEIGSRVTLEQRDDSVRIHGRRAVTAVTRVSQQGQDIAIWLAWIAKDGMIYQVLGATTPDRWAGHQPAFEATARSFDAASAEDLARVYENRLRLAAAKDGETLGMVSKRARNTWSLEKTAVANGMSTTEALEGGDSIKVSRRERYVSTP